MHKITSHVLHVCTAGSPYLRSAALDGDLEQHHASPRAVIGIHQRDCDAINDMWLVHGEGDDPLCWHAHVLDEQGCSDGAAEHHATAEGAIQPCRQPGLLRCTDAWTYALAV